MSRKNKNTEKTDKAIGRKIYELRLGKGWSRSQLAALVDVTQQQINKYELGSNRITAGRLLLVAKAFKVSVHDFFDGIDHFQPLDSNHERLCMELSRVFLEISHPKQQVALVALARTLH